MQSATRRTIKSHSPRTRTVSATPSPSATHVGNVGESGSSSSDAIVLTLSIALGVSLIVVIVLVCVYVSRNNGDNVCQDGNSDVQYVDVDVLSRKPDTVLATASHKREPQPSPVVKLNGPLADVAYKSVKPAMVNGGTIAATVKNTTAAASLGLFKKINADALRALVDKDEASIVVIASGGCGACIGLMRSLAEVDSSDINVLDASELRHLPDDLKKKFEAPYVPQFFTAGKKKVVKGKTGAMHANAILAYIAEQKKGF